MKIVKVQGGLGNQLFQYAFYKALQKYNSNKDIYLDKSLYETDTFRKYGLDHFNTQINIATEKQIKKIKNNKGFRIFFRLFYKNFKTGLFGIYQPEVFEEKRHVYYQGYFQTEKYFSDIKEEIIKDLQLKNPINDTNKKMIELMTSCNSVSLHIRRGDYVELEDIHGLCNLDYYNNALKIIKEKVKNPKIFVFSDDLKWCKENLNKDIPMTFVDINDDSTNYLDLNLMRNCKHNIIANSTFSWWGAWLNTNQNKIVIAPKIWHKKYQHKFKDIIPESWIRL